MSISGPLIPASPRRSADSLAEPNREVVFLIDPENEKVIGVTNGIHQLIGLETIDIVGREFATLYTTNDLTRSSVWNSGETRRLSFLCADNSRREFDVTLSPVHATDRQHMKMAILHVPASASDSIEVQARHRIETQALHTLQHPPRPEPLSEQFFSKISHQIRTPLGIILSSAGILGRYGRDFDSDQQQEYIHAISDSVSRITNLLDDVVWLGKLQSGGVQCKPKTENLLLLCHQVIEEVRAAAGKPTAILFQSNQVPPEVQCDEALLRLLLLHLLSNAVRFTDSNQAVQFQIRREGTLCHFTITDAGIGIPDADREHLFKPFTRGSNVGDITGNGLGLAIVRQCVILQGGTITYDCPARGGTLFHVTLPLYEPMPSPT
ncbi:MAG: hypothetical protein B9S32_17845 [Verrucomicrobia bacterium Tous-C9LFEB]|nr:MAG: hypothetical protein B9S32_17845 [Verrucomicrobia bacterium Tous-C9LFEB]